MKYGQVAHHFLPRFGHQRHTEVAFDPDLLKLRVSREHLVNLVGVVHRLAANNDFARRTVQVEFGIINELAVKPERKGAHPRPTPQQLANEGVAHIQSQGQFPHQGVEEFGARGGGGAFNDST